MCVAVVLGFSDLLCGLSGRILDVALYGQPEGLSISAFLRRRMDNNMFTVYSCVPPDPTDNMRMPCTTHRMSCIDCHTPYSTSHHIASHRITSYHISTAQNTMRHSIVTVCIVVAGLVLGDVNTLELTGRCSMTS